MLDILIALARMKGVAFSSGCRRVQNNWQQALFLSSDLRPVPPSRELAEGAGLRIIAPFERAYPNFR